MLHRPPLRRNNIRCRPVDKRAHCNLTKLERIQFQIVPIPINSNRSCGTLFLSSAPQLKKKMLPAECHQRRRHWSNYRRNCTSGFFFWLRFSPLAFSTLNFYSNNFREIGNKSKFVTLNYGAKTRAWPMATHRHIQCRHCRENKIHFFFSHSTIGMAVTEFAHVRSFHSIRMQIWARVVCWVQTRCCGCCWFSHWRSTIFPFQLSCPSPFHVAFAWPEYVFVFLFILFL